MTLSGLRILSPLRLPVSPLVLPFVAAGEGTRARLIPARENGCWMLELPACAVQMRGTNRT